MPKIKFNISGHVFSNSTTKVRHLDGEFRLHLPRIWTVSRLTSKMRMHSKSTDILYICIFRSFETDIKKTKVSGDLNVYDFFLALYSISKKYYDYMISLNSHITRMLEFTSIPFMNGKTGYNI